MTSDKVTKMGQGIQNHAEFINLVKASLDTAKNKTDKISTNEFTIIRGQCSLPCCRNTSGGLTAAVGGNQIFQQAAVQSNDGGWKLACILVAIFGFIATVSSMFKKQFDDRLLQGNQCVGKRPLALDLAITTGTSDLEDLAKEYGEIVKSFSEFVR